MEAIPAFLRLYVKYPKYGWNGFSEDAFNQTLENELKEIEVHNEI